MIESDQDNTSTLSDTLSHDNVSDDNSSLENKLSVLETKDRMQNDLTDRKKYLQSHFLNQQIIETLKQNLEEVTLENIMLQQTIEKYKKLYYDLCNTTQQ
jgi:hypothetical protein